MDIKLLSPEYKNDGEGFYKAFLNDEIDKAGSPWIGDEAVTIPKELPDFLPYLGMLYINDKVLKKQKFLELVHTLTDHVIGLNKDIYMDELFWHSWFCIYKRDFLLETYPRIKQDYESFAGIVLKKFDWENYIYKALLIAQYVTDNVSQEEQEHYYNLILQNMDMFNYIIKYEIFRNGKFLIDIMKITEELKLSNVLKAKIKDRPDLGKDERYGRRVIYEFNKSYPVVLSPMLEYEELKKYFLRYLAYYYKGNEVLDVIEEDDY